MENLILLLISLIIIASKFLNCFIQDITGNLKPHTWSKFLFTLFWVNIVFITLYLFYPFYPFGLLYIIAGFFSASLNLAKAHTTYTGKKNRLTKLFK